MKKENNPANVAILGPPGTFTEAAARKLFPGAQLIHCDTASEVFEAVDAGTEYGVVAIENSLEGSVSANMDCLMEYDLKIYKEFVLDIHLCLMALPGTKKADIKTVISHSHVFGQCKKFLKKEFAKAKLKRYDSTVAAVKEVKELCAKDAAAIAPENAATLYGLEILYRNVEDAPSQTRFIALSKKESRGNKSSIIFMLKDRPGALYQALKDFADQGVNLSKIESRPAKKKLGEYSFYVDMEGSLEDKKVKDALRNLEEKTTFLKLLGSY